MMPLLWRPVRVLHPIPAKRMIPLTSSTPSPRRANRTGEPHEQSKDREKNSCTHFEKVVCSSGSGCFDFAKNQKEEYS